ncbi:hypothetical protein D3C72_2582020 [compost metagenome]
MALGVGEQRVAALQHQARVEQLQPQGRAVEPLGLLHQAPLHFLREVGLQRFLGLRKPLQF